MFYEQVNPMQECNLTFYVKKKKSLKEVPDVIFCKKIFFFFKLQLRNEWVVVRGGIIQAVFFQCENAIKRQCSARFFCFHLYWYKKVIWEKKWSVPLMNKRKCVSNKLK